MTGGPVQAHARVEQRANVSAAGPGTWTIHASSWLDLVHQRADERQHQLRPLSHQRTQPTRWLGVAVADRAAGLDRPNGRRSQPSQACVVLGAREAGHRAIEGCRLGDLETDPPTTPWATPATAWWAGR